MKVPIEKNDIKNNSCQKINNQVEGEKIVICFQSNNLKYLNDISKYKKINYQIHYLNSLVQKRE